MQIQLSGLVAFLLALARSTGFVMMALPFASPLVPKTVQAGIAAALALGMVHVASSVPLPLDSSVAFIGELIIQALTGALLGFMVTVFVNTAQSAGSLLGLFGGFSPPPSMDPLGLNQVTSFGQFYELLAVTLLFSSGGDALVVGGLVRSMGTNAIMNPNLGLDVVVKGVTIFFGAAFQIAVPVLAVMFLSQIVLGIMVKVAPQLNAMMFAFPLQILLSLVLIFLSLALLPAILSEGLRYAFIAERDLVGG